MTPTTGSAVSAGRRITAAAVPRQNGESEDNSLRLRHRRSESTRSPARASMAGNTTTAPIAAAATTAIAARPTDRRK